MNGVGLGTDRGVLDEPGGVVGAIEGIEVGHSRLAGVGAACCTATPENIVDLLAESVFGVLNALLQDARDQVRTPVEGRIALADEDGANDVCPVIVARGPEGADGQVDRLVARGETRGLAVTVGPPAHSDTLAALEVAAAVLHEVVDEGAGLVNHVPHLFEVRNRCGRQKFVRIGKTGRWHSGLRTEDEWWSSASRHRRSIAVGLPLSEVLGNRLPCAGRIAGG